MIIIDRIADGIAVLETENGIQQISARQLPPEAREGDVVQIIQQQYQVDAIATAQRRTMMLRRLQKMKKGRK
jgi:hypothetical protein